MATADSLRARKDQIVAQFHEHADLVREVQQQAVAEILPALRDEDGLDEEAIAAGEALLRDRVTVFRFCRRARFSPTAALKLLHATVRWRLTSSLQYLTPASVHPLYLTKPLFFFHPDLVDRFGRPCAVLNLRHVQRTDDGTLDALKDYARLGWEVGRRYLTDLSRQGQDGDDPKLQIVVIVDLEGAGMSNLEMELLPFFLDLLKSHFPGMVGAIFVLNYGWAYAGMWQLAKRVLPNTALERILFPSKAELFEFFDEEHLLVEHGGQVRYEYSPSNPILEKYGHASPSAGTSLRATPAGSSASLASEVFQSAPNSRSGTPSASPRMRTIDLAMTRSLKGDGTTSQQHSQRRHGSVDLSGGASSLRRVRSLAELQHKLEQTQREIESDDSLDDESASDDGTETATGTGEEGAETGDEWGDSRGASTTASGRSSRFSSRATSRAASRVQSREVSPLRRRVLEPLSGLDPHGGLSQAHTDLVMSPYNASNPHFGYPAYVPTSGSGLDPTGIPRPRHLRRRKRDLVRTLTYLAALRFLALHRAIHHRLNVLLALLLRLTGFAWWRAWWARRLARLRRDAAAGKDPHDRRVHWVESNAGSPAAETASAQSSASSSATSLSSIIPPQPHDHSHHHPSQRYPHTQLLNPSALRSPPNSTSTTTPFIEVDPSWMYLLLLFLVVRTPNRRDKLGRLARAVAVGAPAWAAGKARRATLRVLLGKEVAEQVLARERTAAASS
ncbi:hypothetical protein DMC30DRAFT_388363 [Rhodotorula diobovata]|uniref:CRAL-TRIO domain-containing protein n=1 Tax=Rhodotorula diobovata TaxID=5288 RepID=A0A5C5G695_9BASI|nr:hypothetical protein DMC30DRAFT_388363 [Rhodotorula diobovata]